MTFAGFFTGVQRQQNSNNRIHTAGGNIRDPSPHQGTDLFLFLPGISPERTGDPLDLVAEPVGIVILFFAAQLPNIQIDTDPENMLRSDEPARLFDHEGTEEFAISAFTETKVSVVEVSLKNDRPAIVPEVSGAAHITGRHEFLIDPEDPLRNGFLLR